MINEASSTNSTEQLICIIEQFVHTFNMIGETLVDVSKYDITEDDCIEKIRRYIGDLENIRTSDAWELYKQLKYDMDMKTGGRRPI